MRLENYEAVIVLDEDGTYDVDVFDLVGDERDEGLSRANMTQDEASTYIDELIRSGRGVIIKESY